MNNVTERKWIGWVVLYPPKDMRGTTLYLEWPPERSGRHTPTGTTLAVATKFGSKDHAEFWAKEIPHAAGVHRDLYDGAQVQFVAEITRLEITEPNEEDA